MAGMTRRTELQGAQTGAAYRTPLSWASAALAVSALGLAGSLWLSLALKLKACPLCFYQRTFVMGVFAVLSVGLLVDRTRSGLPMQFLCTVHQAALPRWWRRWTQSCFNTGLDQPFPSQRAQGRHVNRQSVLGNQARL